MNAVRRGYMGSQYVLVDSIGRVYLNGAWVTPTDTVVIVPGEYVRWSDVPQAWAGCCPWFSSVVIR